MYAQLPRPLSVIVTNNGPEFCYIERSQGWNRLEVLFVGNLFPKLPSPSWPPEISYVRNDLLQVNYTLIGLD
jgi:hypothetical protein